MKISKIIYSGVVAFCLGSVSAQAALPAGSPKDGTKIDNVTERHISYIVDFNFNSMVSAGVSLIDADEQKLLGMVPTGFGARAVISPDRKYLYTADVFYSRGTRGKRTDVLTAWNTSTLSPEWEVEVPAKTALILTERYQLSVSDDGRFVYIFNFTPSQTVSVVDVKEQRFAGEISVAGCMLSYPVANRQFASICGNGDMGLVTLDDKGKEKARSHFKFFDPADMKMVERSVRNGDVYYFVTTEGEVHAIDYSTDKPTLAPTWNLLTAAEKKDGWRPGGWQLMAIAPQLNRLYVLMHQNPDEAHWEDPSNIIWAFDLKSHKKVATIEAPGPIWSMHATHDKKPLLYGVDVEGGLEIIDLTNNKVKGVMEGMASTPTLVLGY